VTDDQFASAFERCEISNAGFHHRDHIRLAWIYVQRYGAQEAGDRIVVAIRKFAAHHGKPEKYHETMTLAWMRLVAHAAPSAGAAFDEFAQRCPGLLEKSALAEFYSDGLLNSAIARATFVEPDLKPLPE
jgi:hypothetical protein